MCGLMIVGTAGIGEMSPDTARQLGCVVLLFISVVPMGLLAVLRAHWTSVWVPLCVAQLAILWFALRALIRWLRSRNGRGRLALYAAAYLVSCLATNVVGLVGHFYALRWQLGR